jgi:dTDP-4-dehydrorhamnose reductase
MSHVKKRFLVVGGDSLIGRRLAAILSTRGYQVVTTTRRRKGVDGKGKPEIYYDLEKSDCSKLFNEPFTCAFLCAGITSMAACEANPVRTYHVNVTNTVRLADILQSAGSPLVFLSSNTVFDGSIERPDEDMSYCFITEYGRQKAATEQALLASGGGVAVVRLSKVLSRDTGIVSKFFRCLKAGQVCEAFDDLFMSPMSLNYVCESLVNVAQSGMGGIFHLSGEDEISYVELALRLADPIPGARTLVRPVSCTTSNSPITFKPSHPALGMKRTTSSLGLQPESVTSVLTQLTSTAI